ncbi:hypothetical protein [Micromonospora sediminicola]|uniref:hypothetical protein n=1 Tax=Micromonospora sediminicola TaxID=946078 RepID=UPI000A86476C|nr:hypothetical protein [Micromonospora sediminicola]
MADHVQVREIDDDEGQRLLRIDRSGPRCRRTVRFAGSTLTQRQPLMPSVMSNQTDRPAIEVRGLEKSFAQVTVLRGGRPGAQR